MSNKAKERFDETVLRCRHLLDIYQQMPKEKDILRAVVVLAVSALDMYASDRFMEEFVGFIKKHEVTDKTLKFLQNAGFTIADALRLFRDGKERPFRCIRTIVEHGYEKKAMQSFQSIDKLYGFYGVQGICHNAERKSKRKILAPLMQMLNRRHEIVHAADYHGRNELKDIQIKKVIRWLKVLEILVNEIEEILTNKFKSKCSRN